MKNFTVIKGGLSNEEYAVRKLRKEDLKVWGSPDTWDEDMVFHMMSTDEYELERFIQYLEADTDEDYINSPI